MLMNVLQGLVLVIFIASCAFALHCERNTKLGIIVKQGNKFRTDGKQGTETQIGRSYNSDVILKNKIVSRIQSIISYNEKNGTFGSVEYGSNMAKVPPNHSYQIGEDVLDFSLPINGKIFNWNFVPLMVAFLFIVLRALAFYDQWREISALIPFVILIFFLVVCILMRADRQPIIESIMAVLLTYYVEATVYAAVAKPEIFDSEIKTAVLGVTVYTVFCIGMKIFLSIKMNKWMYEFLLKLILAAGIFVLVVMNLILAGESKGARNWMYIGPIGFQPSEIVKLLYAFAVITPTGRRFDKIANYVYVVFLSIFCFAYCYLIKDIGALLQFVVIFVIAIILQSTKISVFITMFISGAVGCAFIMKFSSTAAYRVSGWLGGTSIDSVNIKSILESLTASGIFKDPKEYGYQPIRSMVAVWKNGGLFGNESYDIMTNVEAANSDLVTSILAQRHGVLLLFCILAMFVMILFAVRINIRQQNKMQQIFSCIAVSVMIFAMVLNICGTYGILPLTGIVNPALSDGVSSAICYGAFFGIISSSSITRDYLKAFKGKIVK